MISPMSENWAPEVHTFWPFTTHSSPSRTARGLERGQVGPHAGSLNNWQADDVPPVHLTEVGLLHLFGGVGEDGRGHHAQPDAVGGHRRGGVVGATVA